MKDFVYSLGSFSSALLSNTVSTFAIFYYVDVLKAPPHMISIVMILYGLWNAINDPLFGYLSDITKTRWGRRKPYIIWFSLPLALVFTLFWAPPFDGTRPTALVLYYLLMIFLFDSFYTIVILNWTALFPEMYPTLKERAKVSALRQALGIPGLLLGIALPPMLAAKLGWDKMGMIFAFVGGTILYLTLLGIRENPRYSQKQGLNVIEAVKFTFFNKSFLTYVIASFLLQFTYTALLAALPFYAKYVLKISESQTSLLLASIFVVTFFLIPLWQKITAKIGAKRTMMISMILWAVLLSGFAFIRTFIQGIILASSLALGLAGPLIILDIMIADIADEDQLKTGQRREGMYFGANALVIRLGISLNSLVMGLVLSLSGYNANLPIDAQPNSAIIGFRMLCSLVPIIATAIALLVLRYYPLDGEYLRQIKEKVQLVRSE
ncbi:MFS transporter [Pseudothermotoga sp. U03pept]|uniref:MFS transporter n=1 Tax=Pseudothermotoga sp. U03pept TaxID=3447012 RepID=UPI003F031D4F